MISDGSMYRTVAQLLRSPEIGPFEVGENEIFDPIPEKGNFGQVIFVKRYEK